MEGKTFISLLLSGLCLLPACSPRLYVLVEEEKTWAEAGSYCRERGSHLASVENQQESKELQEVAQARSKAPVWIGLHDDIHSWRWSLVQDQGGEDGGGPYRKWSKKYFNNHGSDQSCVLITKTGGDWNDYYCSRKFPFVCYNESSSSFILVTEKKSWAEAQRFCRGRYTDLASVRNQTENARVYDMIRENSWIGLYRDSWQWTDGSKYSFKNWQSGRPQGGIKTPCVSLRGGFWEDLACDTAAFFICSVTAPVKQQVFRLKVTMKESSVNLEDQAQDLLQQIALRLQDFGLTHQVKLAWRKRPDGKVFTLEEEEEEQEDTCT